MSLTVPFSISTFVVRRTSQGPLYLLIRRCDDPLNGTWQMVTGTIEKGETATLAALREVEEETGLVPQEFYCADTVETFYIHARDRLLSVPVFVAFVASEHVTLCPSEHDAYEWLSFESALQRLLFAEQKRTLTHVHHNCVLHPPHPFFRIDIPSSPHMDSTPCCAETGLSP